MARNGRPRPRLIIQPRSPTTAARITPGLTRPGRVGVEVVAGVDPVVCPLPGRICRVDPLTVLVDLPLLAVLVEPPLIVVAPEIPIAVRFLPLIGLCRLCEDQRGYRQASERHIAS